jgi:hypothetical protein
MGTTFHENWFDSTADPEVAFGQAETNDNSLMTNFSGTAAPANTTAGKMWFKMSSLSTEIGLRIRNSSNNAWHKILTGTSAARMWQYRNDADVGWIIDSSVTDVVISVKSSDASGYGSTGGVEVGNWTLSGGQADYTTLVISGTASTVTTGYSNYNPLSTESGGSTHGVSKEHKHTITLTQTSHLHTLSNPSSWRPAAAVGVIVYPYLG